MTVIAIPTLLLNLGSWGVQGDIMGEKRGGELCCDEYRVTVWVLVCCHHVAKSVLLPLYGLIDFV